MAPSVDDIFDRLNGPAGVGRIIGKPTEHAAAMKRRASIPVRYWSKLIEAARADAIEVDEKILIAAHSVVRSAMPEPTGAAA